MPVLAVWLYHRPEDLWDLPLLVQSLIPDYRLRVYLLHNGKHTLAIEVADAPRGSRYKDWFGAAAEVIDSFTFSAH